MLKLVACLPVLMDLQAIRRGLFFNTRRGLAGRIVPYILSS